MHQQGFSLLELMLTLVIISLLVALAYPSYTHYLVKTRRHEAQIALLDLSARLEHYYLTNHYSYKDASLTKLQLPELTQHEYYRLAITTTANTYLIKAMPLGIQATQDDCGTLTLNELGQRGAANGVKDCWG